MNGSFHYFLALHSYLTGDNSQRDVEESLFKASFHYVLLFQGDNGACVCVLGFHYCQPVCLCVRVRVCVSVSVCV